MSTASETAELMSRITELAAIALDFKCRALVAEAKVKMMEERLEQQLEHKTA